MESTADHQFSPKTGSPALKKAIAELAAKTGRDEVEFVGIRMGDAYDLAVQAWGESLPEFWRIWNSWNTATDVPAPWGDL
ncbi:MAG: hypothetical protein O3B13_01885 [Planctomycetota bacterium]|nr:hypothetical protein [Planctomycetota bacterium]MDA1161830.1 hypothetical protein [Planctomycetota bacterium]